MTDCIEKICADKGVPAEHTKRLVEMLQEMRGTITL